MQQNIKRSVAILVPLSRRVCFVIILFSLCIVAWLDGSAHRLQLRGGRSVQNNQSRKFAHTYCKFFSDAGFAQASKASPYAEVVWEKNTDQPFSELIVSWNALRPDSGYITIWVSTKFKGEWTRWHRLAQWGCDYQQTFVNKLHPIVHTKHCRVEMQRRTLARGFRIKATFHQGARRENLKAFFGCTSRLNHYSLVRPQTASLASVSVPGVPRQSQMVLSHERFRDLCSPTSVSMLVSYFYQKLYGAKPCRSMHDFTVDLASRVHDQGYLDIYGNWILNVAEAFDAVKGAVYFRVERLNNFYDLYHYVAKKIPVAVSVRRLPGGATPYANGHIMLVVGWNRQKNCVLCIDPAFGSHRAMLKAYRLMDFLHAWGRSSNLAYVPMPHV